MRAVSNIVATILLIGVVLVLAALVYGVVTSRTRTPPSNLEIVYCRVTHLGNNTYAVLVGLVSGYGGAKLLSVTPLAEGSAVPIVEESIPDYVPPNQKVEITLLTSGKPDTVVVVYDGGETQCTPK